MNKILIASHGPLANGMKKTAEFLMGQNENVETLCAYVDAVSYTHLDVYKRQVVFSV